MLNTHKISFLLHNDTDPPEDHVDELLIVDATISIHICLSDKLLHVNIINSLIFIF